MTTIKSFTDISQSKKLAEILPLESADYHYIAQGEKSYFYPYSLSSDAVKDYDEEIKYIPCWSLAALLSVLPDTITNNGGIAFKLNIKKNIIEYSNPSLYLIHKFVKSNNLIDACVEMILKLNGLNLL